jgi:hypothetical protein
MITTEQGRMVNIALPPTQLPLTPQQQQLLSRELQEFKKSLGHTFNLVFTNIHTFTTGVCLLTLLLFPITNTNAEEFIQLFMSTNWSIVRIFQILMTISFMAGLYLAEKRRDFWGYLYGISTVLFV